MEDHSHIKMCINADDFGYCPERNSGIIDCFKAGAITNTSLMVNSKYSADAANLGMQYNLPMGLHFNISEGKPISEPNKVKSLLLSNGCFKDKSGTLLAAENGTFEIEDIKRELESQIEKFKKLTGAYPRRVDGHQHVHIFPTIRVAFAQILQTYGIRLSRLPNNVYLGTFEHLNEFRLKVASYSNNSAEVFSQHGIKSSDLFIGCSLMNSNSTTNLTLDDLKVVMENLPPTVQSIEFMAHPGYPNKVEDGGCGVGPDNFSKDICRKLELDFLISSELKDFLTSRGLKVQSWESLIDV